MGKCKYCGQDAGLLRNAHSQCKQEYRAQEDAADLAIANFHAAAIDAARQGTSLSHLELRVQEINKMPTVTPDRVRQVLAESWATVVELFLEDGVLDESESERLSAFKQCFGLSQEELDTKGAYTRFVKAATLREVLSGNVPQNVQLVGQSPVNLQKGETVVWAFPGSEYLEDRTRRQFTGSSHGASVRVMKGVYYRASAFNGQPVTVTERVHVDTGLVLVTSKNIYFAGPFKSMRVPYNKVLTFQPYSDGVGIMRDAANAKAQFFITGDGWFTYNLVANLAQI